MTLCASTHQSLSRSEQKRQQILLAANDLFCRLGFPHTSMDEVAKQAGVSKQTVYAHFGSKDELFVAAIESKCIAHNLNDAMRMDVNAPESTLTEFALQFAAMVTSPEAITVFKACVAQSESHPEVSQLFYDAGPKHMFSLLAQYLSAVEAKGDYEFGNAQHSAIRLCLMLFGELKLRLELGLAVDDILAQREQYVRGCAQMFLRAHRISATPIRR